MKKSNTVPRKILSSKLLHLKMRLVSEHSALMYSHMDATYMRERAREEILSKGDLSLAIALCMLAEIKEEKAKPHGP